MAHTLPALPYAVSALEPHIDALTMTIHHGKHHNAYVTNLNAAIDKAPELANWSLGDLCRNIAQVPEGVRTAVRNNGGGHWNHSLFWELMAPNAGGEPGGELGAAITRTYGDFGKFRDAVKAAAVGRFGSGWALFFEAERVEALGYPDATFPDAASWLVDEERRAAFERLAGFGQATG
mgnify:CR=1 FL=1